MRSRLHGDAGQAFPIYITVVAGLLFLAFAYLAVGQAAVNRNGAQTAADAAALAAAQSARDQFAAKWVEDILDPTKWLRDLHGQVEIDSSLPCLRAEQLATQNDAKIDNACPTDNPLSYFFTVTTNKNVGSSVVPGTEDMKSTAHARAVVKPLCNFSSPGDNPGGETLPGLTCKGNTYPLDPDDLKDLPKPEDLFDVYLADSPANND
ncbi:pilus assembly protein TadG-related protein [Streptomyces sp. NPDC001544]|uniref:pilus assembly protein TadG-related protein n=1 Tax=Streptomyces sp. NPDC001544 TaxID=3364584 RepID=UPI0036B90EF3